MNDSKKIETKNIIQKVLFVVWGVMLVLYGVACVYLYYMQAGYTEGGLFESDLYAHIDMAMDGWGYSVTAIVYRLFGFLPLSHLWIAVFLAIFTIGGIVLTAWVLKPYVKNRFAATESRYPRI